jgi:hypothetical protein
LKSTSTLEKKMNHRHIGFNWRATMGNAATLTQEVTAYLDLLAVLVQDDVPYHQQTAARHTCAACDPVVMLHHVRRQRLSSTPADHRLYDRAVTEVRQHRQSTQEDGSGRTPCTGCQEMEAAESLEQALFKLVASIGPDDFKKPGWSSPVSAFVCDWDVATCGSHDSQPCNRVYMHVKRIVQDAHDGCDFSKEVRLNGAGLKLYIKGARVSGTEVTFGMRVGGDQLNDYPGFQAFAHRLFNELGVPTKTA